MPVNAAAMAANNVGEVPMTTSGLPTLRLLNIRAEGR